MENCFDHFFLFGMVSFFHKSPTKTKKKYNLNPPRKAFEINGKFKPPTFQNNN
jgi:hypothetical protein